MDKLERIMRRFDPEKLRGLPKDTQLNIRLAKKERDSMEAVAKACDLSVGEYLLTLHRHVLSKWKE